MKHLSFILLSVVFLVSGSIVHGQESSDQSISRLKEEIARRETIDRDEGTPADLKARNRRILDRRRDELVTAIQARIAAVQKYLETLGPAATEEEKQNARDSLHNASAAATDGLTNSSGDSGSAVAKKPMTKSGTAKASNQQSVYSSFLRTNANADSNGSAVVADAAGAPFKIASPKPNHSTGLSEIEVTVTLIPEKALGFDVDFNVVVKDKDGKEGDKQTLTIKGDDSSGTSPRPLKLTEGENTIEVTQAGKKVSVKVTYKPPAKTAVGAEPKITIENPEKCTTAAECPKVDASTIDAYLKVSKDSSIKKIKYQVQNGDMVFNGGETAVTGEKVTITLRIAKGQNLIRFSDVDDPLNTEKQLLTMVICDGKNCASDFQVATIPTNSRFTRAIVGIEQAGASSAESKSNPFLDFFFTTPLKFDKSNDTKKEPVPRFGTWGQVRFSTTPEQTSSFAVFPSNFVNQATDPTKVVDLVQSFDFLGGVEARAFTADGWIWTLIPGIRQRTSLYFTFGGGAISPLSVKRESAQLFTIPADAKAAIGGNPAVPADPRRAEFIRRFGDPKTATYVGFVPLERDRFFRQYYVGLRLKTHYCKNENDDCHEYKNRFPSIVDFGIGQNEAVTGGRLKSDVRDAANNLIGRRRAWVMRLDAFFPLPIREANFLYLYGTALMKIGGGGVRIQTPLFLDTPASTIQITDPSVYIPPADLQPTRVDRDYYKIGIGVNLTDLFNRNKPKGP